MAIFGMSMEDIMNLTLVQFLLYSVEAMEIEKQMAQGSGGQMGMLNAGQNFKLNTG